MENPNKETGIHDVTIERRSTFPLELTLTADGSVWDITGYTFIAQVWNTKRTVKYADFAVDYADRANGKINFKLTPAQTETFKLDTLKYDIQFLYYLCSKVYNQLRLNNLKCRIRINFNSAHIII